MESQKMGHIQIALTKIKEFATPYSLPTLKMDLFNQMNSFNKLDEKKLMKDSVPNQENLRLMKA